MDHNNPSEAPPVVVVMVPFPAQGHLNQLLHFSLQISGRGVPVHFVGSATHNKQAKLRVHGWDPCTVFNIHFHDLPLPPFSTPPPDPNASIGFPAHLQPTFDAASVHLRQPFSSLLRSLAAVSRRVAIVHDSLMSFAAQESGNHENVEAYSFRCISAFASLSHRLESIDKSRNMIQIKFPELPSLSWEGCFTDGFSEFVQSQHQMMSAFDAGNLFNTCRPVEGDFLDLLAQEPFLGEKKRLWAVGPLNPIHVNMNGIGRHPCMEWLDKQPPRSVLYVSFGTLSSMSDEQVCELAVGLESSKQRFIWVLREADRGDIFAEGKKDKRDWLPKDYEKRVEGMGMVVGDWAPQLEILAHPSTGGFLSHCGWNSCIESISMGVPMAAWPIHSDQPSNTMLVTNVLRIGVVLREWGKREEIVGEAAIEDAVRVLMASKEGEDMRGRVAELANKIRESLEEGGSSDAEMASFIAHILR